MTKITIPQPMRAQKHLVAIPQEEYKEFLTWQKTIKTIRTFKPTPSEKKMLVRGRRNFSRGNYFSLDKIKRELDSRS